jgi:hypothetical protein
VFGTLIEIVGDKIPVGRFDTLGVPAPICDGLLHPWVGLVLSPNTVAFAPGKAASFINALACGDVACTQAGKTTVIDLTRSPTNTNSLATETSSSTRTIRLPSGRSYGNAVHAATATWGH